MEVVLDRDQFLKGLQMVHNIVEPRQTLPILANVLLEAEDETIRVTATDLEVGARVSVPAKVASKGAITLSARKLAEIVKELPAAGLTLKVGESAAVNLRCAGVNYRLVGLASDDFPAVVRSEEHTSELQSRSDLVCRLLLEKKKKKNKTTYDYRHKPLIASQRGRSPT